MANQFGSKLKELRNVNNLYQKHIANALDIDTPLYSKIERGERKARKEYLKILSSIFKIDEGDLHTLWLADQINTVIENENLGDKKFENLLKNLRKK